MLFGSETISHYSRGNVLVWMAMAFQAGLINIGGFMACHRFVSHVTGFATYFGYELNQTYPKHAIGMLAVPLFFLIGCMISAELVDSQIKRRRKPKYYFSFGLICLLQLIVFVIGLTGLFGTFGEPLSPLSDYALLALLCLACGIQNATVTTVSRSVIRTTHLTGLTTDLGIGLVRVFHNRGLQGELDSEVRANLMRAGIIVAFGLGSALGGFVFKRLHYGGFALPIVTSGALFFLMLYFQVYRVQAHAGANQ